MSDNGLRLSDHPADPRRQTRSGPPGVKLATGHNAVSQQAACGNWISAAQHYPKNNCGTPQPHKHHSLSIATWNVRGLSKPGTTEIVEKEMDRYKVDILCLTETHNKVTGHYSTPSGKLAIVSGHPEKSFSGVALFLTKRLIKNMIGYESVNDRILRVKIGAQPYPINLITVYAPTSSAPEDEITAFYGILDETIRNIPKKQPMIILGDWNAKIGSTINDHHLRNIVGSFGLGVRNERGERLLDFCAENGFSIMNTWFQQHPRRLYTWTSPNGLHRNQIDYIMISQRWRSSISVAKTRPGADCGSDHQLLTAKLRIRLKARPKEKINKPVKLNRTAQESYRREVTASLLGLKLDPFDTPEVTWVKFKSTMQHVAKQAEVKHRTVSPKAEWMSADTWAKVRERKALKENGLNSEEDRALYAEVNKSAQRLCRKDRGGFINNICNEVEKCSITAHTRDMFAKVKSLAKDFKPKHWAIEDDAGSLLSDKDAVLDRWKSYCEQLFSDATHNTTEVSTLDFDDREPDILRQEVEEALHNLKLKACGSDGITAQMLKDMGDVGISIMHTICQKVWRTGHWPDDWTESIIVPLHKKGSTRKCENYRTISLISHASKIFLRILNRRLETYVTQQIPREQAGFVKGRGTREQILNIRLLIEKCREHNIVAALCFIDYAKAFDCISWGKMFSVMKEMGIPDHLTFLVQNLYIASKSKVKLEDDLSHPFHPERGVRQGCILSPQLFNLIGEHIMRRVLENWKGGIRVGGQLLSNLRFADDTTIIGSSETELAELLSRISSISIEYGLLINRSKTKLMFVDRAGTMQRTNELLDLEVVHKFVYLGSQISDDGDCDQEVVRRTQMAKSAVKKLERIWQSRSISRNTKIRLMQTLIFSIFLYASETWTLKSRTRARIDAFEMWCWRRMLRISWTERRTNVSILNVLRIKTRLSTICLQRILKFFGHTVRRDPDSLERLMITGSVEGKRSRGRSPTQWTHVMQDATGVTLQAAIHMAQDRCQWRELVTRVMRHHDHVPQS